MSDNIIYVECKHCGGLMPKTNYPQHLFCSKNCQVEFYQFRKALTNLLQNPNVNNGTLAETIKVVHNSYQKQLKPVKHFGTKYFEKLIDYGYIVETDINSNLYKLSQKFYDNFNELGIDKFIII